jgi:hypothetical protein
MKSTLLENRIENLLPKILGWNLWGLGLFNSWDTSRKVHVFSLPEFRLPKNLPASEQGKEDGDVDICRKILSKKRLESK